MGLMGNTVSIVQMQIVEGDLPPLEGRYEWVREQLLRQRFIDIKESAEETSVGFVELHNPACSEFIRPDSFWLGDHIAFTIRQDVRRIPGAVLQEELQKAANLWLERNPAMTRVPKGVREDLKEATRLKLLAKTLPVPAIFDVAWHTETGTITIGSTSKKSLDLFDQLMRKAFPDLRIRLITPYDRALEIAKDLDLEDAMKAANCATTEGVCDLIQSNRWIGSDFFLWLLHAGMNGEGGEVQTAWIDNKIVLHKASEEGPQTVSIAGPQYRPQEVKAAIRDGKKITEATVYFQDQEYIWRFTLKGEAFYFAGFKCPNVMIEQDNTVDETNERQAVFFERMHLLGKGLGLFRETFARFLQVRLATSTAWIDKLQEIHEWLQEEAA